MSKPFVGASRKHPCPLCGRKEWPCYWRPDGSVVWCKVTPSDRTDRQGNYCHVLQYDSPRPAPMVSAKPTPRPALAPADHRHAVYSALLSRLTLSPAHYARLEARGLDRAAIESNGYRSTPARDECDRLASALADFGLDGVPGFFFKGGAWRLRWPVGDGFFVPYRDAAGLILGMMYRLDAPLVDDKGKVTAKYLWLSSDPADTDKGGRQRWPRGSKLCPPVHVAGRHLLASASELMLTEGALKGDVAAHLLGVPLLCAGGVTQWGEGFAEGFRRQYPGRRAVVAYDSDWRTNPHVRRALESLMASLRAAGVPYAVRSWPQYPQAKGVDDLALLLSESPREVRAA